MKEDRFKALADEVTSERDGTKVTPGTERLILIVAFAVVANVISSIHQHYYRGFFRYCSWLLLLLQRLCLLLRFFHL